MRVRVSGWIEVDDDAYDPDPRLGPLTTEAYAEVMNVMVADLQAVKLTVGDPTHQGVPDPIVADLLKAARKNARIDASDDVDLEIRTTLNATYDDADIRRLLERLPYIAMVGREDNPVRE